MHGIHSIDIYIYCEYLDKTGKAILSHSLSQKEEDLILQLFRMAISCWKEACLYFSLWFWKLFWIRICALVSFFQPQSSHSDWAATNNLWEPSRKTHNMMLLLSIGKNIVFLLQLPHTIYTNKHPLMPRVPGENLRLIRKTVYGVTPWRIISKFGRYGIWGILVTANI